MSSPMDGEDVRVYLDEFEVGIGVELFEMTHGSTRIHLVNHHQTVLGVLGHQVMHQIRASTCHDFAVVDGCDHRST